VTPEAAFVALVDRVGATFPRTAYFSEAELGAWPDEAVSALRAQNLLSKARPASSTVCPGCEQQCMMPVEVLSDAVHRGDPFVVCDKRSDIGRVAIDPGQLRQWKSDGQALGAFVASCLGMSRTATASEVAGLVNVGVASGDRRAQMIALRPAAEPVLVVASSRLPLADLIEFDEGAYGLDVTTIRRLIDAASPADSRYVPRTARREARKLATLELHERWAREYRRLRKESPGKSDVWYAKRIGKSEVGQGFSENTIRKHMTK
jgi:hypothetical protein